VGTLQGEGMVGGGRRQKPGGGQPNKKRMFRSKFKLEGKERTAEGKGSNGVSKKDGFVRRKRSRTMNGTPKIQQI